MTALRMTIGVAGTTITPFDWHRFNPTEKQLVRTMLRRAGYTGDVDDIVEVEVFPTVLTVRVVRRSPDGRIMRLGATKVATTTTEYPVDAGTLEPLFALERGGV